MKRRLLFLLLALGLAAPVWAQQSGRGTTSSTKEDFALRRLVGASGWTRWPSAAADPRTCSAAEIGDFYINSATSMFRGCDGTTWIDFAAASGTISGSGTTNTVSKWSSAAVLTDSNITDTGAVITATPDGTAANGRLTLTGAAFDTVGVDYSVTVPDLDGDDFFRGMAITLTRGSYTGSDNDVHGLIISQDGSFPIADTNARALILSGSSWDFLIQSGSLDVKPAIQPTGSVDYVRTFGQAGLSDGDDVIRGHVVGFNPRTHTGANNRQSAFEAEAITSSVNMTASAFRLGTGYDYALWSDDPTSFSAGAVPAATSGDQWLFEAGTLNDMNGSDDVNLVNLTATNGTHTGAALSNELHGWNTGDIGFNASTEQSAFYVESTGGWDFALKQGGPATMKIGSDGAMFFQATGTYAFQDFASATMLTMNQGSDLFTVTPTGTGTDGQLTLFGKPAAGASGELMRYTVTLEEMDSSDDEVCIFCANVTNDAHTDGELNTFFAGDITASAAQESAFYVEAITPNSYDFALRQGGGAPVMTIAGDAAVQITAEGGNLTMNSNTGAWSATAAGIASLISGANSLARLRSTSTLGGFIDVRAEGIPNFTGTTDQTMVTATPNATVTGLNGDDELTGFRIGAVAGTGATGTGNQVNGMVIENIGSTSNQRSTAISVEGFNWFIGSELPGRQISTPTTVTCADSEDGAPATATVTTYFAVIEITNADADGCDLTLAETSNGFAMVSGDVVEFVVVSNAGLFVEFSDTSGVTELAGPFSAGLWDTISMRYAVDRWVERSRSDN